MRRPYVGALAPTLERIFHRSIACSLSRPIRSISRLGPGASSHQCRTETLIGSLYFMPAQTRPLSWNSVIPPPQNGHGSNRFMSSSFASSAIMFISDLSRAKPLGLILRRRSRSGRFRRAGQCRAPWRQSRAGSHPSAPTPRLLPVSSTLGVKPRTPVPARNSRENLRRSDARRPRTASPPRPRPHRRRSTAG